MLAIRTVKLPYLEAQFGILAYRSPRQQAVFLQDQAGARAWAEYWQSIDQNLPRIRQA
jgi:hypothetical protein